MSASSTKSRLHLNSFEIKIIALIFMTFDHFGAYQTAYGGGQRPLVRSRTAAVRSE